MGSLEQTTLDDAWFVVSELAAALLLGPELAAYSLPAIPGSAGEAIVLSSAVAGAGCAAIRASVVVGLMEVGHGVIAHGRCAGGCKRIAHARWATGAARVIGQCIAATSVARCNTGVCLTGRGGLGVEPRV